MSNWYPLFEQGLSLGSEEPFLPQAFHFSVDKELQGLRLLCCTQSVTTTITDTSEFVTKHFSAYTDYPAITPVQADRALANFPLKFKAARQKKFSLHLFDSHMDFRGRWSGSSENWKTITPYYADPGFVAGSLSRGIWTLYVFPQTFGEAVQVHIQLEGTGDPLPYSPPQEWFDLFLPGEGASDLRWAIGELHEHTLRSQGIRTAEDTVLKYRELGYSFLAVTDHDNQPLSGLTVPPGISLISGQEIETSSGHALLFGTHNFIRSYGDTGWRDVHEIIHEAHEQRGLFCVAHPFALLPGQTESCRSWIDINWRQVDLLEVWAGMWSERFPEIIRALELWDNLLSQGIRITGVCGKGSGVAMDADTVDRLPKMILQSEGISETALLTALKLGNGYMTIEPAVSLWVESEYGGGIMGDEIRLPQDAPFLLYLDVSCIPQGAFVRIKSSHGNLCEMPVSSTRETHQKFILRAKAEVTWYRAEVYRYGRGLDELLALTNPVYIRGMISF